MQVAIAEGGRDGEVRYLGEIDATEAVTRKLAAKLAANRVGDLSRFRNPRQLMGYLGLAPSERSTGDTVKRGGFTKAGNGRARRVPTSLELSPSSTRFP